MEQNLESRQDPDVGELNSMCVDTEHKLHAF